MYVAVYRRMIQEDKYKGASKGTLENSIKDLAATEFDDANVLGGGSDMAVYQYALGDKTVLTEDDVKALNNAPKIPLPREEAKGKRGRKKKREAQNEGIEGGDDASRDEQEEPDSEDEVKNTTTIGTRRI